MARIDAAGLAKAMALAPMTATQLADQAEISISYMGDIIAGRRNLKRNPALRRKLATALGVPQHWIELDEPAPAADETAA